MKNRQFLTAAFVAALLSACLPSNRPSTAPFGNATGLSSTPGTLQIQGDIYSIRQLLEINSSVQRRDVIYCTADEVELRLDFYLPVSPTGAVPLVILVHGGGWSEGDKRIGEGLVDGPVLLAAGFAFASLNYRLAPQYQFPAMIQDVKCAVRFFRAHAGEYSINPHHIGIYGPSAGGHLASLVGLSADITDFEAGEYLDQSSQVQAVAELYGPSDLTVDFSPAFARLLQQVFGDYSLQKASPVTHVSPDDPPFLILHGELDQVVPLSQSQLLSEALLNSGVSVELVVVKNGAHGFESGHISPTRAELTALIVRFFSRHLEP